MKELLYFKPSALIRQADDTTMPGSELFSRYRRIYSAGAMPADRTGSIHFPFALRIEGTIPVFRPQPKTLREICDERAQDIVRRAETLDARIYCLWSGGIDSTLALVSILKNTTPEQKQRITVLLSLESIEENGHFFYDHIHTKLEVGMSTALPSVLGSRHILVSGECNDQLFGSDIMATFISAFGVDVLHEKLNLDHVVEIYSRALRDESAARFYTNLFQRLLPASPIPLTKTYDFMWWINFTLKWNTVCWRMLTFTAPHNREHVDETYARERFFPFYATDDFQLWSLNNHDKKIKDTWKTYKWPCKDLIYEYTKDAEYRDHKTKRGSLGTFIRYHNSFPMIGTDFTPQPTINLLEYYRPGNDFAASL